tara:strand:- start:40 stop:576 length:537 start_codon:yes stop_codon:yes gene_type:complete
MRKNRLIIKSSSNPNSYPAIYIRMLGGKVMYVGETENWKMGRPTRVGSDIGEYDQVVILKACKNRKRRMYWEAFLVCKLGPLKQLRAKYDGYLLNRNIEGKERSPEILNMIKENKFLAKKRAKIELDSLRKRNNRERLAYWIDQAEQAKVHFEESKKCIAHFYVGYKQDQITAKNGQE